MLTVASFRSLLWAEHKFNCGITGLRKAEKILTTIIILVAPTRQKPMKILKHWNIREVANDVDISFCSCQAIFMYILGMKLAASKIVPKLLNFEQKQHRIHIAQEILTTFNDDSDLLKKVIAGDKSTQSTFQMFLHI